MYYLRFKNESQVGNTKIQLILNLFFHRNLQFHRGLLVIKTDTLLGKDDSPYLHNSPNLLKDWERLRLNFCTVDNPLADLEVVVESENLVLLTEATTDSVKKKKENKNGDKSLLQGLELPW